jgi:hypothetical protein
MMPSDFGILLFCSSRPRPLNVQPEDLSGFAFAEFEMRFSLDLVVSGPAGISALGLSSRPLGEEGAFSPPSSEAEVRLKERLRGNLETYSRGLHTVDRAHAAL